MPKPIKSATMQWLIDRDPLARVSIRCLKTYYVGDLEQHKLVLHYGTTLLAVTVAAWFGPQATIADIERMAVCAICGARAPHVSAEPYIRQPGFSAGGYTHSDS